jgi:SNF2 family DNA or RNA helicase
MIFLDESSMIKNGKTLRTQFVLEKLSGAKRKYIGTATPVTNNPLDIYTQFKFLDPSIFSHMKYSDFKAYYCILEKHTLANGRTYNESKGYKNMDDLRKRIKYHSMELKIEDCEDLPGKIYTRRPLEMLPALKKQYNDMLNNAFLNTPSGMITSKLIIDLRIRLHQILSGIHLKHQKDNMKLIELENIIDENLHSGNQIIIWCEYLASMDLITSLLDSKKIKYSEIRGATKDRKEQVDRFQNGTTKVFVGQVRTGGMSITLTAGNITVYYENTFSLEDRLQTEGRPYRIGQDKKVVYIDLPYKGTIDMEILEAIKKKINIAQYVVKSFKKPEKQKEGAA